MLLRIAVATIVLVFVLPAWGAAPPMPQPNERIIAIAKREAARGDAGAQAYLDAIAREDGQSSPRAAAWVLKMAEGGHRELQYHAGYLLEIVENMEQAVAWYTKSAAQGHAEAQTRLGILHFTGRGLPKDDRLAIQWVEKGAAGGDPSAQVWLGGQYLQGKIVAQDVRRGI
jgi:TPR repeat protein